MRLRLVQPGGTSPNPKARQKLPLKRTVPLVLPRAAWQQPPQQAQRHLPQVAPAQLGLLEPQVARPDPLVLKWPRSSGPGCRLGAVVG